MWNTQIFKKFEIVKVWKFSHSKKSAITFAQGCTQPSINPQMPNQFLVYVGEDLGSAHIFQNNFAFI